MKRLNPGIILAALFAVVAPTAARADVSSLGEWERIPVQQNGRVMPMDSYARQLLLGFSGKSAFNRKPAVDWLSRVLFTPDTTHDDAIFLVNHPEVVEALGLSAEGRGRYSYAQLEPALPELLRLARAAYQLDAGARSPVESELLRLYSSLMEYRRLLQSFEFLVPQPELDIQSAQLRSDLELPASGPITFYDLRARKVVLDRLASRRMSEGAKDAYSEELFRVASALRIHSQQQRDLPPALFPPANGGEEWITAWDAFTDGAGNEALRSEVSLLRDMANAYRGGDQAAFDTAAKSFAAAVAARAPAPSELKNIDREVGYNKFDAFYRAEMLYGFAFIAALLSVAFRSRWIYALSILLAAGALIPHTYGIIARMLIMGRPPVTNLYSTFVFVGWTCALIGLAVEYFQRNRLGLITAGSMGLALLLVSGRFGADNDTMGVMVAVLDSNFWLAAHVVTISIGYAGCAASGLLGHIYLLQALRRTPDDAALKETDRAVYGAQAFGLIFSFLGTMLGGVWADQSWGRFWGWDPKENGALVIVLWSAILFHARSGRMIGPRGFAAGSVLGVIAVLCAWLGVNLLNVGLHSYGFTSGVARGLLITCGIELLFAIVIAALAKKEPAKKA